MDLKKWENVIVDWVNCLNLTKPIKVFQELTDGVFFCNLMNLLTNGHYENPQITTLVHEFLKEHYSNFILDYLDDQSFENMAKVDILLISLLLLHYSCIHDRRDVLTSPLCHRLPQKTQVYIKTFLETATKQMTRDELLSQITKSNDASVAIPQPVQLSHIESQSPLQDLLQTPPARSGRLQEKDREINKLQNQIEMERDDKADLQLELVAEKEKNKKLNEKMNERTAEIIKLRSEILEIENRVFVSDNSGISRSMQKCLRSEIESLEGYVSQLQDELNTLQNEKDSILQKLNKVEPQYLTWHERAINSEQNYENLMEKYHMQELEFQNLQSQCLELTVLLEELRSTKCNESSLEVDNSMLENRSKLFHNSESCEDLACAVVEVQLKDAQKENNELKNLLKDSQESAEQLNDELCTVKKSFSKLQQDYKMLQNDNNNLLQKVSHLIEVETNLQTTHEELQKTAEKVKDVLCQNTLLDLNITDLNNQLDKMKTEFEKAVDKNNLLNSDLMEMRHDYHQLRASYSQKLENCNTLEEKSKQIQEEYGQLLEKYNTTNFKYESLTNNFNQLSRSMDDSLKRLVKFISGDRSVDLSNKEAAFDKIFIQLEDNYRAQITEKNLLLQNISNYEELLSELRINTANLEERETLSLQERDNITENLKTTEEKVALLQHTVEEYTNKIQNLNITISEMQTTIVELEKLRGVIEKKETIIANLESTNHSLHLKLTNSLEELVKNKAVQDDLTASLDNLKRIKKDFEVKILGTEEELSKHKENENNLQKSVEELTALTRVFEQQIKETTEELHTCKTNEETLWENIKTLENLKTSLEEQLKETNDKILQQKSKENELEKNMFDQEKRNQEVIKQFNIRIDGYTEKLKGLETELQDCKINYASARRDLGLVTKCKETLYTEMGILKDTFQKRVQILDATILKLEKELEDKTNEKLSVEAKWNEKYEECEKLILERGKDASRLIELQCHLDKVMDDLSLTESQSQDKEDLFSRISYSLANVKFAIQEKNGQLTTLHAAVADRDSKIQELTQNIQAIDEQNMELSDKIMELRDECLLLESTKTTLQTKCEDLESNAWNIVSELSRKNEQLNEIVHEYKQYQEKTEADIASLTVVVAQREAELENFKVISNTMVSEYDKKISEYQSEVSSLNKIIGDIKAQEIEYIEEIRNLRSDLNDTMTKYTESLQNQQEMKAENETQVNILTENLHELIEKYNNLDKTHIEVLLELKRVQEYTDSLQLEKNELDKKLFEQKAKYESEYNECNINLTHQISELTNEESKLNTKISQLTEKLKSCQESNTDLEKQLESTCTELSQVKLEKSVLTDNINNLSCSFKELKDGFNSLKETHNQLINEYEKEFTELQRELSKQISLLVSEHNELTNKIIYLQKNIEIIKSEQEIFKLEEAEKLKQKELCIEKLKADIIIFNEQIATLNEEKKIIKDQISSEKMKTEKTEENYKETIQQKENSVKDMEENITKLKCANEILETGKVHLEEEVSMLKNKITALEQTNLNNEGKHLQEMQIQEKKVKKLKEDLDILQKNLAENETENTRLVMELCNVNETLNTFRRNHQELEQLLAKENQDFTEKLTELGNSSIDKQNVIENLQAENQLLTEQILTAKTEIESLKDKLKTFIMDRQSLELEIKTLSEKLLGQDSVVRRHEAALAEANTKILDKLKEVLELEKDKRIFQEKMEQLSIELDRVRRHRDDILESQAKVIKETENNLIRAHENAIEVKADLLNRIEQVDSERFNEKQMRTDLEKLMEGEKIAKEILEIRVLELVNEKSKCMQVLGNLKQAVMNLYCLLYEKPIEVQIDDDSKEFCINDVEDVNSVIDKLREKILELVEKNIAWTRQISYLESEKEEITQKIQYLTNEKESMAAEKENFIRDYNILSSEKIERNQELIHMRNTIMEHEALKEKYEQLEEHVRNNEEANIQKQELQDKIIKLEKRTAELFNTNKKFASYSITYKTAIEKLINERNILEGALNNLKHNFSTLQMKMLHISDDREHTRLMEQVESFETILEDIQKQFLRTSKKINCIVLTLIQIPDNLYNLMSTDEVIDAEDLFEKIKFEEELEKVVDCRDRATDLLEQMFSFESSINAKMSKPQKENVLRSSNRTNVVTKVKDEELKKKNTLLKQRLTLAENARSNLEKKIKQLREENKMLNSRNDPAVLLNQDASYKILLQQHIQAQEGHEKALARCKEQYDKLLQEYEEHKRKVQFLPEQIRYEKSMKTEQDMKLEKELIKLREAYGNVMGDNSKLDLENATMRKLLEDRTAQLSELKVVKESYEKLLEENNKLRMELDTVKYKRNRDREALVDALKKDREDNKKIQEIRSEYEGKLEKMKEKMVQLYREEIDKETQKLYKEQNEKALLIKQIEQLKQNLKMKQQRESRNCEFCNTRSFCTFTDTNCSNLNSHPPQENSMVLHKGSGDKITDRASVSYRKPEERKYATLPRLTEMNLEDNGASKRNTLSCVPPAIRKNLEMEDEEEDLFNNKYLMDLKEGRCVLPSGQESNISRLSELKWRNSLCPPHLKSSYPAETQFNSPRQFKDDDLKVGIADFDDSMSTKLIPGEKHRKKDFGTTSYKKPGPPTPSKNGGRPSLQGNEIHPRDLFREQTESKTPKQRTTPSRLRALFMGRNTSARDMSENQPGTPRSKRLSIFRKPK